jgi:Arc/MetJ family transcription regulator
MATNLALDNDLIEEAQRLGEHRTKREAVTVALEEYVQRRRQRRILDLVGTIDMVPRYNYKSGRKARR